MGIFKSNRVYYNDNIYNINTTYLVVLKYSFISGADNDSAKMVVFNSGVPVTEPAVPTAFLKDNVDMQNIGFVFLSNSYA